MSLTLTQFILCVVGSILLYGIFISYGKYSKDSFEAGFLLIFGIVFGAVMLASWVSFVLRLTIYK